MKPVVAFLIVLNAVCFVAGMYRYLNPMNETPDVSSEPASTRLLPAPNQPVTPETIKSNVSSHDAVEPTNTPTVPPKQQVIIDIKPGTSVQKQPSAKTRTSPVAQTVEVKNGVISIKPIGDNSLVKPSSSAQPSAVEASTPAKSATVGSSVTKSPTVQTASGQKAIEQSPQPRIDCVEFGPFREKDNINPGQLLGSMPSDVTIRQKQKSVSSGPFLVYAPIPTNAVERARLTTLFKEKQIDFFSTKLSGTNQEVFSLGVFNEPVRAEKFCRNLQQQGIPARSEQKKQLETFIQVLNAPEAITSRYAAIRARYPKVKIQMRCSPWS